MWKEGLFAFDANVLLNLYRYSAATRQELLKVLRALQKRIWLPHQAALEFHRGRVKVISDHRRSYADLKEFVTGLVGQVDQRLSTLYRDTNPEHEELRAAPTDALQSLATRLSELEEAAVRQTNSTAEDPIWKSIVDLFDKRVGPPYDDDRLADLRARGVERYSNGIPPGFADAEKNEIDRYSDFVMWSEILDLATEKQLPIILVTDDRKDDWWWKVAGQTVGPLPALIDEVQSSAGVSFYMYTPEAFLRQAAEFLGRTVEDAALREVESLTSRPRSEVVTLASGSVVPAEGGPPWQVGDAVQHRTNGPGVVAGIVSVDGREMVRVSYPSVGIRRSPSDSTSLSRVDSGTSWSAGDRVRHPRFGDGIVVARQMVRGDEELTVAFVGKGVKRLIAAYANLTRSESPEPDA